jgi:hypothetical protein
VEKFRHRTHGPISRHESNLRKSIFEANFFCGLRVPDIGFVIPAILFEHWALYNWTERYSLGSLRYFRNHQASRNIRNPVGKFDTIRRIVDIWSCREPQMMSVCENSIGILPRVFRVMAIDVVAGLPVYEAIGMSLRMSNDKRAVAADRNCGSHIQVNPLASDDWLPWKYEESLSWAMKWYEMWDGIYHNDWLRVSSSAPPTNVIQTGTSLSVY